jgi:CRP-like cAMP-binding protein
MKTIEPPPALEARPFATVPELDLQAEVANHPFCHGLSRQLLQTLADCAMRVHFEPGQMIFREGDIANRFYLIERGQIALESTHGDGRSVPLQKIGAGDVLGWSWLFPPYYWHFDARALTPTDAIFFYGTRLREACEADSDLGHELLKRISRIVVKRIQAAERTLVESAPAPLPPLVRSGTHSAGWTHDKSQGPEDVIVGHPFFETMSAADLSAVTRGAKEKVFEPGELIVRAGEAATHLFIIEEGKVVLEFHSPNSRPVPIQVVGPGEVFGWSWLFPPFIWHFHARALEGARVVVLDRAKLLNLCETNPGLGYELMLRVTEVAIQRLQATRKQVLLRQRREFAANSVF